jgi:hypothetical protein
MAIVRRTVEFDQLSARAGCAAYINLPVLTLEAFDGRGGAAIGL